MTRSPTPPVCDYEGSDYRARFWEEAQREYEDRVERIALRRLMPAQGRTFIEIGAGFGRLADEYRGYNRVVLFDYSRSLLREAQARLKDDPRFIYVAGNWYRMPFVEGLFETMVQVRTIHHAADVPALFAELARIARPNGCYILEHANKQNLKAILRYLLKRQTWSPFAPEPIEFVELNFDFHPRWIKEQLRSANFIPQRTLSVSHLRLPFLKRRLPTSWLVTIDSVAQYTGKWWQLTPSVFVASDHPVQGKPAAPDQFFACPECRTPLAEHADFHCPGCSRRWQVDGNFYDFKEPLD